MTNETQFTLGEHNARLEAQDKRLERIEEKVDAIMEVVQQNKGERRHASAVWGAIGSALGIAIGAAAEYLRK